MNLKIIKPGESGKGILVEFDAGYISPKNEKNSFILESTNMLDHSKPFEFYAVLQKYNTPIETVEYILNVSLKEKRTIIKN